MTLAEMRGRFLYEIRPDLFTQGFLTDEEFHLWELYYEERNRKRAQR